MKNPNVRLPRLVLVMSLVLSFVACSDDSESEPGVGSAQESQSAEAPREETQGAPGVGKNARDGSAARASAPPAGQSAKAEVQPGKDWALKVSNGSYLSTVLPGMYRERCIDERGDPQVCNFLRRLLIVEITMGLEEIQKSRDQRGADEAVKALSLDDEPRVLVAALRVLGQFPDTPGIKDKVLPLMLDSPWINVQSLAASVLAGNPDTELAAIASTWNGNHSTLYSPDEFSEYPDFAPHYLDMDFPEYPDAEWFSPLDTDRSVGWWTDDDIESVVEWMTDELDVEPLSFQQWNESLQAQSMAAFSSIDEGKQAEVQRLLEEFGKTQDMALLEKAQKLQEEMYAPMQQAGEVAEKGVGNIIPPGINDTFERARYFVVEEQDGHVARSILVYPLKGLGRTVIQEAWNLVDYPSAWPPVESPQE